MSRFFSAFFFSRASCQRVGDLPGRNALCGDRQRSGRVATSDGETGGGDAESDGAEKSDGADVESERFVDVVSPASPKALLSPISPKSPSTPKPPFSILPKSRVLPTFCGRDVGNAIRSRQFPSANAISNRFQRPSFFDDDIFAPFHSDDCSNSFARSAPPTRQSSPSLIQLSESARTPAAEFAPQEKFLRKFF